MIKSKGRTFARKPNNPKSAWPFAEQNRFCRLRRDVELLQAPLSLKQLLAAQDLLEVKFRYVIKRSRQRTAASLSWRYAYGIE